MTHTKQSGNPSPEDTTNPGSPTPLGRAGRTTATLALVLLTVLAGALGPLQAAANGHLGDTISDGHAAATISFGSGLILMILIVAVRSRTRRQAMSLPRLVRSGQIRWWNCLAGLCGVMVVLSEGVTVGTLGVAVFQISLISGLVTSGVICDRLGITEQGKQPISVPRLTGAVLTILATIIAISPNLHVPGTVALALMPFVAGLLAGWQPAGNAAVADGTGSMLVSIGFNFLVGFVALASALGIRALLNGVHFDFPAQWWLYSGGALGLMSIAAMAALVRGLGLLLLGIASVAGQLLGSLALDAAFPALGHPVHLATLLGTLLALVAAAIGTIPTRRTQLPEGEKP